MIYNTWEYVCLKFSVYFFFYGHYNLIVQIIFWDIANIYKTHNNKLILFIIFDYIKINVFLVVVKE